MEKELSKYDYDILQAIAESEGIDKNSTSKNELIQRIIIHRQSSSVSGAIALQSLDVIALRDIANRIGFVTETMDKHRIINAIEGYRNLEKLPIDELRAAANGTEQLLKLRRGILFKYGSDRRSILLAFVEIMNERERARIALAHLTDTHSSDDKKPDIVPALVSMGIDLHTAREAALRTSSVQAAIDWITSRR